MLFRSVIRTRCEKPPGSWGAPPIPEAQYNSKIWDCVGRFLSPPDIDRFTALATHTADLDASDLRSLMQLCRNAF